MSVREIRSAITQYEQPIAAKMTLRKRTTSEVVAKKTLQTTFEAPVKKPPAPKKIRKEKATSDISSSKIGMQVLASKIDNQKNSKYQEIVCRLSEEESKKLTSSLSALPKKEESIAQLVQILQQAPTYQEAFFASPNWPLYALIALERGLIDEYQFGTLQLYWSIGQYHGSYTDMQIHPLFMPDGTNNPIAVSLIKSTSNTFLSNELIEKFLKEMKKLPPSEQQFFIVPDIQKTVDKTTISQAIQELGINVFSRVGNDMRMIPSLGMMQTFLKVKFGNQAVKINPVLGLSSIEQMKQVAHRDMALAFPGVTLPEEADSYPAPWYDFTYHDFYHAIIVSGMPLTLRSKMIDIADFTLEVMKTSDFTPASAEGQTLCSIREVLIDMEAAGFRPDLFWLSTQTAESLFWNELQYVFSKSFANPSYAKYDLTTAILFFQRVAQKLILDKDGETCSLTLDSLKNAHPINRFGEASHEINLNLLQFMLTAVTKPHSKVPSNPCIETEVETEKYMYYLEVNSTSSQPQYTSAEWHQLQVEFSPRQLVPLLLAKISAQQILSLRQETRKVVVENSILVATLLKHGASWEKISQPETLTHFVTSKNAIPILLQMGATLNEIEKLPENLLAFLEKNGYKLGKIAEEGYRFEDFTTLDPEKRTLLTTPDNEHLFSLKTMQNMSLEERFQAIVDPERLFLTLLIEKIKQLPKRFFNWMSN